MKVIDKWLDREFEQALNNIKGYEKRQKINKVFIGIGLVAVAIVTLNILNIF
ncbi:hypothetical protein TSYNTROOL_14260 [Tepidanaerobacter syntrophicus]|jgi:hypothetical protein|uniref:hypothetical protein n=1 Tax=Tepidanaerobacter syntrophicus TaxID=224999 RepID=UPI0022EEC62B|nr:hypothetical protein [Tepidanaerobacter syntrophicus]GLI51340.1 hypothetical protein TSYNTROOL_14260 [Tepidanaerobacter syntrophicus]